MKINIKFLIGIFLLISFGVAAQGKEISESNKETFSEKDLISFQIDTLDSLKANKGLEDQLASILQKHFDDRKTRKQIYIDNSELIELRSFAISNKDKKSALTAKFMIGWMQVFERKDYNELIDRRLLSDMSINYEDSFEGKISKNYLLNYLNLIEEENDPNVPLRLKDLRRGLIELLPSARQIDNDNSELSKAMRQRIINSDQSAILEAMFRLMIALISRDIGETERAIGEFEEIQKLFPNTKWALKAQSSVQTIKSLKDREIKDIPRLGWPSRKKN